MEKYGTGRKAIDQLGKKGYIHTHSEYVILLAFPRQQWLLEGTSILRYTYIACLVYVQYRVMMQ